MPQPQTTAAPGNYEPDKVLAAAVHRKDRKATAEFVQEHADALYAYVFARVRPNAADAEDLTQEVFLAACRCAGDYRGTSSLKAWLLGIARHKIEDYYREKMRGRDLEQADGDMASSVELDSDLERHQLQQRTVTILDRMPEHYRLLLKWRYWDQQKTDDIAEVLGRTPKAVERMLARARERFRREWEAKSWVGM